MKEISLKRGKVALVDDEDYEWLIKYAWNEASNGYVVDGGRFAHGKGTLMHRAIMKPAQHQVIDHINGNPLDNQKCNLRICSQKQNTRNRDGVKRNTSGHKGVFWKKDHNKWCAYINVNSKHVFLGYFNHSLDAAIAYDKAALKYFGEYARFNYAEDYSI
jgi:hypothetical protein